MSNNQGTFAPAYLQLHLTGELERRVTELGQKLRWCDLCPRLCHVNRLKGEKGKCRSGSELIVSHAAPAFKHFDEKN